MLPRIRSIQTEADDGNIQNLPPPIPTGIKVTKFEPKLIALPNIQRGHGKSNYTQLDNVERLIPIISSSIKESKSIAPKELLLKIAINTKLLYFELSAIKIQAIVRKFVANLRVNRIRRRLIVFMAVTEECSARYLEEMVLVSALEISMEYFRNQRRFTLLQDSVERELDVVADSILAEVLDEFSDDVTNETISEVIALVIEKRRRVKAANDLAAAPAAAVTTPIPLVAKPQNPLIRILIQLCEESADEGIRNVVFQVGGADVVVLLSLTT